MLVSLLSQAVLLLPTTDNEIFFRGVGRVLNCAGDRWTAIGRNNRLFFYNYTQTENIKHFEWRMSQCIVRMLSG